MLVIHKCSIDKQIHPVILDRMKIFPDPLFFLFGTHTHIVQDPNRLFRYSYIQQNRCFVTAILFGTNGTITPDLLGK